MCSRLKKHIEILSPGKNVYYAKEAIKCGADSIYIGAPKFSLRHEHGNSMQDIKDLIDYAHKYWVKIYIPLNCLLYSPDDINLAQNMINELYEMGVDGFIIQDIGILELDLPPIPIILSTNTGCYKKEDAKFFEKCGVSRIVLPRELSFEEIKDITDNSNIEIETFCYGFLCVGYSGNCYLAYVENLKKTQSSDCAHYLASNHGVCPERCMGNWTLTDANGNIIRENDRLFNLKFLSLHDEIEKLFEIGVDSFKIAGREKDLKHVKNSTAFFSQVANSICKKHNIKRSSSGRVLLGFQPDLSKNFNKGFTDFFFNGRKKEMYSKFHLVGTYVGIVENFENNSFTLNSDIKLHVGDKLRYQIDNNQVKVIQISDIHGDRYFINELNDNLEGLKLYRYIDVEGFKEVEESQNYRVISTKLNIHQFEDRYTFEIIDEDNNKASLFVNKGSNIHKKENLNDLFFELNTECEFIIDKVNSNDDIIIDSIEDIKSKLFCLLRAEREKNRPRKIANVIKNSHPYYKDNLTYLDNVTNSCTKNFYKRHGVKNIEMGLETGLSLQGKKVFSSRYCLRNELDLCSKNKPSNLPPLPWSLKQLENGNEFNIEFDCTNCSMHLYLKD